MRSRGFTLVEMAVTLAVLALLLMMAMPSIGTWMSNTRIRNTAEALQSGLQAARLEAVRRNESVSFYLLSLTSPSTMDDSCALSASGASWAINTSSPAGKCKSGSVLASRAAGDAGGSVRVSAGHSSDNTNKTTVGDSATTVTFNSFGRVSNIDAAINRLRVTGPADDVNYVDLMLIVDSGGSVRMCDPRASIADTDPRKC
ncbi:MAG: GspH/FimT family pseudopilin [Proteobacteria bacterium]|nr:GspH/FimT family pseudopilin [Pseudomonadota bacterium]